MNNSEGISGRVTMFVIFIMLHVESVPVFQNYTLISNSTYNTPYIYLEKALYSYDQRNIFSYQIPFNNNYIRVVQENFKFQKIFFAQDPNFKVRSIRTNDNGSLLMVSGYEDIYIFSLINYTIQIANKYYTYVGFMDCVPVISKANTIAVAKNSKITLLSLSPNSSSIVYGRSYDVNCTKISSVAWHPTNMSLIIFSCDDSMRVLNLDANTTFIIKNYTYQIQVLPDGDFILCRDSSSFSLYSVQNAALKYVKTIPLNGSIEDYDLSKDGKYLVTQGNYSSNTGSSEIKLWRILPLSFNLQLLLTSNGQTYALAPDNSQLVIFSSKIFVYALCDNGYFLQGNSCLPCTAPCSKCMSQADVCLNCNSTTYFQSWKCLPCSQPLTGCYSCNHSKTCTKCQDGFRITSNNTCVPCDQSTQGCLLCAEQYNCTKCKEGFCLWQYTSSSQTCRKCSQAISACLACVSQNNTKITCLKCQQNTYLNADATVCMRNAQPQKPKTVTYVLIIAGVVVAILVAICIYLKRKKRSIEPLQRNEEKIQEPFLKQQKKPDDIIKNLNNFINNQNIRPPLAKQQQIIKDDAFYEKNRKRLAQ